MSATSANPAPSLKETIRDIHALINIAYKRKALIAPEAIEPFLKALEAQPAAERTTLARIREIIAKRDEEWIGRDWMLKQIDAQERAASKSINEEPLAIRYQDARTNESEIDAQERAGAKP